jgi:hypothetical protein
MSFEESGFIRGLRSLYVMSGLQAALPHGLKSAVRRRWLPVARAMGYPVSSPRLPRPPLPADRSPMRLGRVLMACDLNCDYLDYWPSARRAWLEIVGVEPLLVLIAEEADVPEHLRSDDLVVRFRPIEGVHTALQAQCIRLLYPAVVDTADAVLISDIDLYPLRPSYFLDPIGRLDSRYFVSYRDIYLERAMVSMLFNAATPQTWSDLFGISTLEDVRARLAAWASNITYDGRRAWPGWYTDQQLLYAALMEWPDAPRRWWAMDDDYCRHDQLDRLELMNEEGLAPHRQDEILAQVYSEYVCLFPYQEHREVNDLVLQLALAAAQDHKRRG